MKRPPVSDYVYASTSQREYLARLMDRFDVSWDMLIDDAGIHTTAKDPLDEVLTKQQASDLIDYLMMEGG
jgi:hypothetical protein